MVNRRKRRRLATPFVARRRIATPRARTHLARASIVTSKVPTGLKGVMPKMMKRTLRYKSHQVKPAVTTAPYFYNASSVFDPDDQVGGHQPAGFDQIMQFYDHFKVDSSKIVVKIISPEAASTANQIIAQVFLQDTNSAPTFDAAIENGLGSWGVLGSGASTGSNGVITLNNSFISSQFFGNNRGNVLQGSAAANPTDNAFYGVRILSANTQGGTTNDVTFSYEIVYEVTFSERKTIAVS